MDGYGGSALLPVWLVMDLSRNGGVCMHATGYSTRMRCFNLMHFPPEPRAKSGCDELIVRPMWMTRLPMHREVIFIFFFGDRRNEACTEYPGTESTK